MGGLAMRGVRPLCEQVLPRPLPVPCQILASTLTSALSRKRAKGKHRWKARARVGAFNGHNGFFKTSLFIPQSPPAKPLFFL